MNNRSLILIAAAICVVWGALVVGTLEMFEGDRLGLGSTPQGQAVGQAQVKPAEPLVVATAE